jgi:Protein of unknown function (DUF4232)
MPATAIRARSRAVVKVGCGLAVAAALAAALSGCGSASPQLTAKPSTPALARCAKLRIVLDTGAAGAAAGSSFFPINFINTSRARCELAGYPKVLAATGAAGLRFGAPAAHNHSVPATAVILRPGSAAHAWLQVLDAMNFPANRCHPLTARWITVQMPGQNAAVYLPHTFPACTVALHGSAMLSIQPIQPGRGRRGTAQ